jgi:CPA2 family monovalent cation:H+ antiporter-2
MAAGAMPGGGEGAVDLAAAPRRALVTTLQLAVVAVTLGPILAVTQLFLPPGPLLGLAAAVLLALGVAFWRGASNLHGHVRAGAQVIVEALARQAQGPAAADRDAMARLRELLPGLGEPVAVRLEAGSAAAGQTLASLDLRGLTGATVLAIWRPDGGVMSPGPREVLRAGDLLAVAGTDQAVAEARRVLSAGGSRAPEAGAPGAA